MRSMTGHARVKREAEVGVVTVELKSVNHRGFKLSSTLPGPLAPREREIAALLREEIARGSLSLTVVLEGVAAATSYRLDAAQLQRYAQQARAIAAQLGLGEPTDLSALLALPGVCEPAVPELSDEEQDALWALCADALRGARDQLVASREREGAALQAELEGIHQQLTDAIERAAGLLPGRVDRYRERLRARIEKLLAEHELAVDEAQLLREVAVFAERSDVAEELARMRSHLAAYAETLSRSGEIGRRLEFLAQEMVREVNTLGSKGSDGELLEVAIGAKQLIERAKEQLANVE